MFAINGWYEPTKRGRRILALLTSIGINLEVYNHQPTWKTEGETVSYLFQAIFLIDSEMQGQCEKPMAWLVRKSPIKIN